MSEDPYWFYGNDPPEGLPDCNEILSHVNLESPRGHFTYPVDSDSPVCWVKYGFSVYWNEVLAQNMACEGLAKIQSDIRAPAVYFAFRCESTTVIVMEYIQGRTVEDALVHASDAEQRQLASGVAAALSALVRVLVTTPYSPSAVDRGLIRHTIFDEQTAPRHYESVEQLEQHINLLLERSSGGRASRLRHVLRNLSEEPMVYCFSDVHPSNFMVDTHGRMVVIDFAHASILPASFALYTVHVNRLDFDLTKLVDVPGASLDNVAALCVASGRITMGSGSFARMGQRIPRRGGGGRTRRHSNVSKLMFRLKPR